MNYIVNIADFVSFLSVLIALIILCRGWKRALRRDAKLLFAAFLGFLVFHSLSNFLEWVDITRALDPLEDYLEILGPILWIFFF